MADVQMTDVSKTSAKSDAAEEGAASAPTPDQLLAFLRHNLALILRAVSNLEPRFTARVLRSLPSTRKNVKRHPAVLAKLIEEATFKDSPVREQLLALLPAPYVPPKPEKPAEDAAAAMDIDKDDANANSSSTNKAKDGDAVKDKSKADKDAKDSKDTKAAAQPPAQSWRNQPFKASVDAVEELNAYVSLLVVVWLLDGGRLDEAQSLARKSLTSIVNANRRTLDLLGAKAIFYLARTAELIKGKKGSDAGGLAEERSYLLSLHRSATLRHDPETQATVINLLLRSYIVESNLYAQADKLVSRAPFPRAQASNGQIARYEYYVGRIRAVQLNYTEAHGRLQQAIRRAPQSHLDGSASSGVRALAAKGSDGSKADEKTEGKAGEKKAEGKSANRPQEVAGGAVAPRVPAAAGFLQTAYKFLVVVELLMGDIPERRIFRMDVLKKALAPYMEIVKAVRVGDLSLFQRTLSANQDLFLSDKTHSLILRLRHNVIKTGIRTISLAYSRISLADITRKLHLESEEDAEYIVAKAIRDGVIEASVDHTRGEMRSKETGEVYMTNEPQAQFKTRIGFCLQLHNESVKAMRYPLNNHKAELASAVEARERERELANEIADGDISDDDEDWV